MKPFVEAGELPTFRGSCHLLPFPWNVNVKSFGSAFVEAFETEDVFVEAFVELSVEAFVRLSVEGFVRFSLTVLSDLPWKLPLASMELKR